MDVVGSHPAVGHLGTEWNKKEEYYYWELKGGYLFDGNIDLLQVRLTGSQFYDAPRPISWYKTYDGGRSFYTAMGHNSSDYNNDEDFRIMAENSILWAGGLIAITPSVAGGGSRSREPLSGLFENTMVVYPNPVNDILTVSSSTELPMNLKLVSITGTILKEKNDVFQSEIDVSDLKPGLYILIVNKGEIYERLRVIKK